MENCTECEQDVIICPECFAKDFQVTYGELKKELDYLNTISGKIEVDVRVLKRIIEFALKPPWISGQLTKDGIAVIVGCSDSGWLHYEQKEQTWMLDSHIIGDFVDNDIDFEDFYPVIALSQFILMNPGVHRRFQKWYNEQDSGDKDNVEQVTDDTTE